MTFLSDARQPEMDFLHTWAVILNTFLGRLSLQELSQSIGNTNTVASRLIKREKGSLPVDVRRSKTSLLKLPNYQQNAHWAIKSTPSFTESFSLAFIGLPINEKSPIFTKKFIQIDVLTSVRKSINFFVNFWMGDYLEERRVRIAPILFRLHVSREESLPFKNFSSPSRTSQLKILDRLIIHGSKKWQKNPWKARPNKRA